MTIHGLLPLMLLICLARCAQPVDTMEVLQAAPTEATEPEAPKEDAAENTSEEPTGVIVADPPVERRVIWLPITMENVLNKNAVVAAEKEDFEVHLTDNKWLLFGAKQKILQLAGWSETPPQLPLTFDVPNGSYHAYIEMLSMHVDKGYHASAVNVCVHNEGENSVFQLLVHDSIPMQNRAYVPVSASYEPVTITDGTFKPILRKGNDTHTAYIKGFRLVPVRE